MPLSVLRVENSLIDYLQEVYPKRENIEVLEVKSLTKGWETELYSFLLKYTESSNIREEHLILRIYPGAKEQKKIKWEYEVLQSLYKAGYSVPRTHILELNESFFGKPFIIMDRIVGKDMGEEFVKALESNDQDKIVNEILPTLTKLFVELHNLDWHILTTGISKDDVKNPFFFIDKKLAFYESFIKKYQLNEVLPILDWLKEKRDTVPSYKISIVHRDFHPHNVIISNEGKPYIIDWPASSVGDFREDLGWTLLLVTAFTTKEIRDAILRMYEQESGSKVEEIEYFEILAALRRFTDMLLSFRLGPSETGMRDEAIHQMKEMVYHLENVYTLVEDILKNPIPELEKFIKSISYKHEP
jgi:aminoglycoside phosphotransferase (APT) family kinase protein